MSISTFSIIYYDFTVSGENKFLSFDEGAGELIAEVETGDWTATELAVKIKVALDATGTQAYTVTFNRAQRSFTISADSSFDLLVSSGTSGASIFGLIAFTGADRTGLLTYESNGEAGDYYEPQFILQDYVPEANGRKLVSPSINKTANGRVEVIRFGVERFIQMNIKFITDIVSDGKVIKSNVSGVDDANRFMRFAIEKKPFEFMENIADRSTFLKVILDKTPASQDGTEYSLREYYDRGLPGVYESGILTLRVLEY